MSGPLSDTKVLSFCRALAGPFATMILGDLGAEIIKIEDPQGGDSTREGEPKLKGVSTYFLSVNRGKKSVTLNLKDKKAQKIIFGLIKDVDVLVENFRPGVMKRLGLDYETVRNINPKIVYASISGFGQTGPYSSRPAYDMLAQGMGGVVSLTGTGEAGSPPVRVGYSIGDMAVSLYGVIAIQAALIERERSGEGQWVDVAMLDSQVALCENAMVRYLATGEIPKPTGSRHPLATPFQIYQTKDKPIILIANSDKLWVNFCKAAGKEDWIKDERYRTRGLRLKNYRQFNQEMVELMSSRSYQEWVDLFEAHEVMYGPVNNMEEVSKDPQVMAREMIVEVEHPRAGRHKVVGTPMKFSRTPCKIDKGAPELGVHTVELLSTRLGLSDEEIKELRESKTI
ncbi:MAG: carnitine dehydratase [Deltaproteobacteria bacterium RBG_13_43_22]|nr:MAG: carnitine dehydratase [Deltaproteobacteria bacterium RBG_13_43_22]